MRRTQGRRPVRLLLAVGLLAAGGVVLTAAGAEASTEQFSVTALGGSNGTTAVGTATGTITATKGDTTATYSVNLCGNSTYPSSSVTLTAGTASVRYTVNYQNCETFAGTLTSTSGISSATVSVTGATFVSGNQYTTYTKTRTVTFAGTPVTTPSTPATPATRSVSLAVRGNSQSLGTVTGSITATRGGSTATYSVTLCGQSTYPSASVTLTAGTASVRHTVNYQNCETFTGTLTSTSGISSATVVASGSTFASGNVYTTYTDSTTVSF